MERYLLVVQFSSNMDPTVPGRYQSTRLQHNSILFSALLLFLVYIYFPIPEHLIEMHYFRRSSFYPFISSCFAQFRSTDFSVFWVLPVLHCHINFLCILIGILVNVFRYCVIRLIISFCSKYFLVVFYRYWTSSEFQVSCTCPYYWLRCWRWFVCFIT